MDIIYIQAKRWANPVGAREIRDFVGALEGKGARKGIFITTSIFSKSSIDFVSRLSSKKIIIIDGEKLVDLMIEYNVGVSIAASYDIKRIDLDYFMGE